MDIRFKLRRGTLVDWTTANPVLKEGEPGYEVDTGRYKLGNGSLPWLSLPYFIDESRIATAISEAIANAVFSSGGGGLSQQNLDAHINSPLPHPVYDNEDGPSFLLLYQNAKV